MSVQLINSSKPDGFNASPVNQRHVFRLGRAILNSKIGRLLAVVLVTSVGAAAGYLIGHREVSLETVIYSWVKSEAQLFLAAPYKDFTEGSVVAKPIDMGSNVVRFPLENDVQRSSFIQRLDPCSCGQGIAVGRIGLRSPFSYEPVNPTQWTAGGSTKSFLLDATMVSLINEPATLDPQVILYLDIQSFVDRSAVTGAYLVGGFTLLLSFSLLFVVSPSSSRDFGDNRRRVSRRPVSQTLGGWVTGLATTFAIFGAGLMVAGALVTGVTIDEGYHVDHLQAFLDGGNYSSATYGPFASLVGHAVNVALGNEVLGAVSSDPAAFAGRHVGVALTGILGIVAVGVAAGVAFRSWSWGLVGAAVLASIPIWVGHSMFNIKDVPAGSGYALFSSGLVVALNRNVPIATRIILSSLFLITGIALGVGTRPGMWPLFATSSLITLFIFLVGIFLAKQSLDSRSKLKLASLAFTVLFGLVSIGALFLAFTEVGRDLIEAVSRSLDHPWSKSRRYLGERVFNRPEAWLVFKILMSQLPLAIGTVFLVGVTVSIWLVSNSFHRSKVLGGLNVSIVVWTVPVLAPFVTLATFSPVLYDGIRQILFIIPGVAFFATLGIWALFQLGSQIYESRRLVKRLSAVILGLAATQIGADQISLFPYNYVFVNEIAQSAGLSGGWETDYWDSSFREALDGHVVAGDPIMCGHTHTAYVDIEDLRPLCIAASPYVAALEYGGSSNLGERQFWTVRSERELLETGPPPANCSPYSAVTRTLRFETLVMSRLYICEDY